MEPQMFCSTSTTLNPFTASYGDPSLYINILDHEPNPNSFHFHHHHNPNVTINPPLNDSNLPTPAPSSNNVMSSKQDIQVINGDRHHHHHLHYQYGHGASSVFLAEKRPVKKDRHSKIYTAQGLRDRRVRLSIEIARKFFDLQDMLGFDKASKTLEWLLTKSRKAIKELAQDDDNNHRGGAKSFSSNSICEEVESENGILNRKRTKKLKKKAAALSSLSLAAAKELREKARARARERTRVKLLCTTTFNQFSKINPDPTFDQTLNQSKPSSLLNHHQQSSSSTSYSSSSFKVVAHNQAEVPNNNIIEESIVIKRKLKPSSMVGTYQQSLLMLKDANCPINNSNNLPNLPPNWDLNSAIARSSLCAITNMNRSTGLHLYSKLWGAENSECLH